MQSTTFRVSKYNPQLYETAFFAGALVFSLLVALGVGSWWLKVPGIGPAVEYADAKLPLLWPWLALGVAGAAAVALHALWKSPQRNFLALDDDGVTHVRLGLGRTWPWRDLESIEVGPHPLLGAQAARLTVSGKFGWPARIAMLLIGRLASSDHLTVTVPDYYETSIEDVVETLNDRRDRVLGITRPAKTAAAEAMAERDPRATLYRMTGNRLYAGKNEPLSTLLVLVLLGGLWFPDMSAAGSWFLAVAVVVTIAIAVGRMRRGSPGDNFLQLDDDGVTYVSWGRARAWRWADLPAFEIRGSGKFRFLLLRDRHIVLGGHAEAWARFHLRPVLRDDYDAPLDEIAATLNAYRERARAA